MQERFKNFTLLIARINRCIRKIKTEEMAEFDLKSTHVSCIYYLYTMQSLTARELCEICDEDKAAISRSIEYLEKNGYLKSCEDDKRRYKRPIELSEKGISVGEKLCEKIDGILVASSEGVSPEDRDILYRSLTVISENLQNICDKYDN